MRPAWWSSVTALVPPFVGAPNSVPQIFLLPSPYFFINPTRFGDVWLIWLQALHDAYSQSGTDSPFGEFLAAIKGDSDHLYTTQIDIADVLDKRRASLLAHRTQIDPESFWMALPDEVLRDVYRWEEYILARTLVETGIAPGEVETDLFAGLRP